MVLFAVVWLIVLANLSFERFMDFPAGIGAKSYGWPLVWHRYVFLPWIGGTVIDSDRSLSEGRLGPEADMINRDYGALPDRQQPFSLPSSDAQWMTPAEKAHFKARGGWARFDAAGWNGKIVSF
ncbi:MAG TPA: hypothetical protein VJ783_22530 [Pirellulales bacterium]|nr:hypothetical protein [Pirellulales bacterium]